MTVDRMVLAFAGLVVLVSAPIARIMDDEALTLTQALLRLGERRGNNSHDVLL